MKELVLFKRWSTQIPKFDMIISQDLMVDYFSFHTYSCFIAPRITQAYLRCSSHAQVCDLLIQGTCWLTFYLSSNIGWQVNIAFFVWGEGSFLKLTGKSLVTFQLLNWSGQASMALSFCLQFLQIWSKSKGLLLKNELFLVCNPVPNW